MKEYILDLLRELRKSESDLLILLVIITTLVVINFSWTIVVIGFFVSLILFSVISNDQEAIGISLVLYVFIVLISMIAIFVIAERTLVSTTITEYKDVKFVPGFKMISNYSTPELAEIIELSDTDWYKLQMDNCVPVLEENKYLYYNDYVEYKNYYKCKGE